MMSGPIHHYVELIFEAWPRRAVDQQHADLLDPADPEPEDVRPHVVAELARLREPEGAGGPRGLGNVYRSQGAPMWPA